MVRFDPIAQARVGGSVSGKDKQAGFERSSGDASMWREAAQAGRGAPPDAGCVTLGWAAAAGPATGPI